MLLAVFGLADDDKTVSRERVEELIRKLDANTLAERSRAERELLDLGPDVLRFLPASELIESVSAREGVRRIRPQIERRAARESSAASLVMLIGEQTVGEIVSQIERQSRNRLTFADNARDVKDRQILVAWDKMPFWECLDDLCLRCELRWQLVKDEARILISKSDEPQSKLPAIQRIGPFRIAIDRVEIKPVVGDKQQRILRVDGHIVVEPRLRPLFLSIVARELKATVDEERTLSAWNPDAKYEFPVSDGGRDVSVQWDFRLPVEMTAKTVSVSGQFRCQIAAATERIAFDQKSLKPGTFRRRGGVSVRIRQASFEAADTGKLNGNIGVAVIYDDGGPAFESHRSWIFHNAVYLETKLGMRTSFTDFDTTQQSDGAINVDYRWKTINAPSDQYLFVYEAPTLIIDVPVDVELGDIPLPGCR